MSAIDTLLVLLSAVLVFFMQAGFAGVESGLVRTKNVGNVLMKNLVDFCIAVFAYFLFGYALMYGSDHWFLGTDGFFMIDAVSPVDSLDIYSFWLFQAMFAGTTATIIGGAVAERTKFSAYILYSFAMCGVIYPIIGHWVWGGGWLSSLGFYDFAGSTVVHTVGGVSGLVGAIMIGPRLGVFKNNGFKGHNLSLVAVGTFILWFGWFGFNMGSALGTGDLKLLSRICINTTLSPAFAVLSVILWCWYRKKKPALTITFNAALGGLVGITAGCSVMDPIWALLVGGLSGMMVVWCTDLLWKFKVDDVVGAFPVHGACGLLGTVLVGVFGKTEFGAPFEGLIYSGSLYAIGVQIIGVFCCIVFSTLGMFFVFKFADWVVGLRVPSKVEVEGLDAAEHGTKVYSGLQTIPDE